eukprot:6148611-Amphidinium_carterae.1
MRCRKAQTQGKVPKAQTVIKAKVLKLVASSPKASRHTSIQISAPPRPRQAVGCNRQELGAQARPKGKDIRRRSPSPDNHAVWGPGEGPRAPTSEFFPVQFKST